MIHECSLISLCLVPDGSWSNEETRLDDRITVGFSPPKVLNFVLCNSSGPVWDPSSLLFDRYREIFPGFQWPKRAPDYTHWPNVEIKNASMQWRG